jgi:hypothetical protein
MSDPKKPADVLRDLIKLVSETGAFTCTAFTLLAACLKENGMLNENQFEAKISDMIEAPAGSLHPTQRIDRPSFGWAPR